MTRLIDKTGKRFGRLLVIDRAANVSGRRGVRWNVACDCGRTTTVYSSHLRDSKYPCCGCFVGARIAASRKKHGGHGSDIYNIWHGMRGRCENPSDAAFNLYGGRGIVVCDRWKDFANFREDIGPRPSKRHSIDRIDNDGPYAPDNCRWATMKEQCANRSTSIRLTVGGKTKTLVAWSQETGVGQGTIHDRLRRGWSHERAISSSIQRRLTTDDECRVIELRRLGLNFAQIAARVGFTSRGISLALTRLAKAGRVDLGDPIKQATERRDGTKSGEEAEGSE